MRIRHTTHIYSLFCTFHYGSPKPILTFSFKDVTSWTWLWEGLANMLAALIRWSYTYPIIEVDSEVCKIKEVEGFTILALSHSKWSFSSSSGSDEIWECTFTYLPQMEASLSKVSVVASWEKDPIRDRIQGKMLKELLEIAPKNVAQLLNTIPWFSSYPRPSRIWEFRMISKYGKYQMYAKDRISYWPNWDSCQ